MEDKLLTTEEAAHYLGLSSSSSLRSAMARTGLRPDGRRGFRGTYLWKRSTLDEWIKRCLEATLPRGRGGDTIFGVTDEEEEEIQEERESDEER